MCWQALMIAGAGVSAGSQIAGGIFGDRAGRDAANIAYGNATGELRRGHFEENRLRDGVDRAIDAQVAFTAANGGDPSYGSPLAVQMMSAMQGETDALLTRLGAVTSAVSYRQQGDAARIKGAQALMSGILGAGSTLLMAGAQIGKDAGWFSGGGSSPFSIGGPIAVNKVGAGFGRMATGGL